MRFLFYLDLILHAGAGIFFWNFELCNKGFVLLGRAHGASAGVEVPNETREGEVEGASVDDEQDGTGRHGEE